MLLFACRRFVIAESYILRCYRQSYLLQTVGHSGNRCLQTCVQKRLFKEMESSCGTELGCGLNLSKEDIKKRLTSLQYQVTQEKDTERAFTGKYCNHFEKGTYVCVVCNQELFSSEAKFESKCGWPSFFDVVKRENVTEKQDLSHDMQRTEVLCSRCSAHLGHVFDDGPKPTKKRYCINSAALDFAKES